MATTPAPHSHPFRNSVQTTQQAEHPVITGVVVEAGDTFPPLPMSSLPATIGSSPTADLNVIRDAVVARQSGAPAADVFVSPNGDVIASGGATAPDERWSAVVGDIFYVDLNAIQAAVLAQQNNNELVADKDRVYVDHKGDVMLGSEVGDPSRASAVVGDIFYTRDLTVEARTAQTKMPAAVKVSDGTYEGYAYSVTNSMGDTYDLFIYYHRGFGVYRVALVSPRLGGQLDVHGGHLYQDGTLCLTKRTGSGYASMEQTYAESVLWTLGASMFRRGYGFQFNLGQDGDNRA